jgi:hypothetical protein
MLTTNNKGGGAMSDRSAHARDISQSVIVTGDGNTVTLTFGDSGIAQSYLKQCEAAGREPDPELLGPVIAVFERINATEEKT